MTILAPDFQILVNDKDVSPKIRTRLINLDLHESAGEKVDTLNIVLDDTDGRLEIPNIDGLIELKFGFKGHPLVNKGKFVFESVHYIDPTRQLSITAHAAAVESAIKKRNDCAWHGTTLGAILKTIADRNHLTARIDRTLASLASGSVHQQNESDLALVQRLARERDATGTIKNNHLIFIPKGTETTATGQQLPTLKIQKSAITNYTYDVTHVDAGAIEAKWHSKKQARYHIVKFGEGTATKRLSHCYYSAESAMQAARAEYNHRMRGDQKLQIFVASGLPSLSVCQPVKTEGFKSVIDQQNWQITDVTHTLNNSGLITNFNLEIANPQ